MTRVAVAVAMWAVLAVPQGVLAYTITTQGAVSALTHPSEIGDATTIDFNDGTANTSMAGDAYADAGITFHVGDLTAILAGVTSAGSASAPYYAENGSTYFPTPIEQGGAATDPFVFFAGVATFEGDVTQVGLTASSNGTQYLTVWDTAGQLLGQLTWMPENNSAFIGIDTGDVAIGMVSYGNDDVWSGATYGIGGSTIISDNWIFGRGCVLDGELSAAEQCDDGNTDDGDGCSSTCKLEYCGNGVLDAGELCDDGNRADDDGCAADCLSDESCGNHKVDGAVGETCDDGNTDAGDGCSATCGLEYCGNGVLDVGEACDDGNAVDGDGCSADCLSDETCGNGVVDSTVGEACDDGNTDSGDGCQATCILPTCGDGSLDAGETCDDGNNDVGDGCNHSCTSDESCGNGVIDRAAGEVCDDGNTDDGDGCSPLCSFEYCGNGVLDPGEVCDDGNRVTADGCAPGCLSDETCGNGIIDAAAGEGCDDGNTADDDGCSASCQLPTCGDGIVDPGEVCDDGNTVGSDGCARHCMSDEVCGNGVVDVMQGEHCDDGNTDDGDGCSASCKFPMCGDGHVDPGEVCDDGNTSDGDGCARYCMSDESCGNGVVDVTQGEQCDDGNTDDEDGCSSQCVLEYCGNGQLDPGEVCDDGNSEVGDGCAPGCLSKEVCGNGIVDVGEVCDDGNTDDGDDCAADCGEFNAVADAGMCDSDDDVSPSLSGGNCSALGFGGRGTTSVVWLVGLGLLTLFVRRRRAHSGV